LEDDNRNCDIRSCSVEGVNVFLFLFSNISHGDAREAAFSSIVVVVRVLLRIKHQSAEAAPVAAAASRGQMER